MQTKLWIILVVFWKTDPTCIIVPGIFNILPEGKSSSYLNLTFMKVFLNLIGLPPFTVSI